ncbi:hypothetical protein KM043_018477 [Ampulex compressa]|nr:hypothetical protein KM043_018477 [Ampulex compressa]
MSAQITVHLLSKEPGSNAALGIESCQDLRVIPIQSSHQSPSDSPRFSQYICISRGKFPRRGIKSGQKNVPVEDRGSIQCAKVALPDGCYHEVLAVLSFLEHLHFKFRPPISDVEAPE